MSIAGRVKGVLEYREGGYDFAGERGPIIPPTPAELRAEWVRLREFMREDAVALRLLSGRKRGAP